MNMIKSAELMLAMLDKTKEFRSAIDKMITDEPFEINDHDPHRVVNYMRVLALFYEQGLIHISHVHVMYGGLCALLTKDNIEKYAPMHDSQYEYGSFYRMQADVSKYNKELWEKETDE